MCECSAGDFAKLRCPEKDFQERSSSRLVFNIVADASWRSAPSMQVMPAMVSSHSLLPTSGKFNGPLLTTICHVLSSKLSSIVTCHWCLLVPEQLATWSKKTLQPLAASVLLILPERTPLRLFDSTISCS